MRIWQSLHDLLNVKPSHTFRKTAICSNVIQKITTNAFRKEDERIDDGACELRNQWMSKVDRFNDMLVVQLSQDDLFPFVFLEPVGREDFGDEGRLTNRYSVDAE